MDSIRGERLGPSPIRGRKATHVRWSHATMVGGLRVQDVVEASLSQDLVLEDDFETLPQALSRTTSFAERSISASWDPLRARSP